MDSIGERLKKIRLEKGLSLDDLHKRTKIHLSILRSIEEDSLVNFSPVYIKGFLKIYCKSLGVDPRDCMPDYKEPHNITQEFSQNQEKPAVSSRIELLKSFFSKAHYLRIIKGFAVLLVAALFVTGLFKLGKFISYKRKISAGKKPAAAAHPKINPALARKGGVNKKAVTPQPQTTPAVSVSPAASSVSGVRLVILAKDNCWVKLKADGKVVFQNVLRKGHSETWQAKEKIELSLSDARAVDLQLNEKLISNLGRKGRALKNIIITKEGLTVPQ